MSPFSDRYIPGGVPQADISSHVCFWSRPNTYPLQMSRGDILPVRRVSKVLLDIGKGSRYRQRCLKW